MSASISSLRLPQGVIYNSQTSHLPVQPQGPQALASHRENASETKKRFIAGLGALGLYGTGHMIKYVPMQRQFSSALLSADPRQLGKTILGIFAVKKLNKALGWENPPGWATAVETAVIVHTLMLGFSRKNLGHFVLILPLLLSSVGLMNVMQKTAGQWAEQNRPQWDDKQKERLKLSARLITTIASIGVGLMVYPKLFMQISKRSLLKPLMGEKAAQEMRDLSYRYLVESKGTPEAKLLLKSRVKNNVPAAFKGLPSVEHTIKHHQSVVHSIGQYHDITEAVLNHQVEGNTAIQKAIKASSYRFDFNDVLAFSKTHNTSPEDKRLIQQVLDELQPIEKHLGQGTFGQDYEHFQAIKSTMAKHRHDIKKLDPRWQYFLHCLHYCADHQLGHQPRKIPFFTMLGAEGAAMTCTNGCCVGSVWCWADLADLVSSMGNTAFSKHKKNEADSKTKPQTILNTNAPYTPTLKPYHA